MGSLTGLTFTGGRPFGPVPPLAKRVPHPPSCPPPKRLLKDGFPESIDEPAFPLLPISAKYAPRPPQKDIFYNSVVGAPRLNNLWLNSSQLKGSWLNVLAEWPRCSMVLD